VILGHPKQNKIMGFWSDALGTAGEAYAENQRAERERAAAERERQRNLPANKQSTWLLLGIGGTIALIVIVVFYFTRK
jgi:hypothetical protein